MKYQIILDLIKEKLEKHLGVWDDVKEAEILTRLYIEISDLYITSILEEFWNDTFKGTKVE